MKKNQKWTAENISDQKGRVAIVTGSSSGIGYEAARVMANKNAEVIIAVRNQVKGDAALRQIRGQNPNADVKVMLLDLASLKSVKNFANEFKQNFTRLDFLINNAGVMVPPHSLTEDGFELQIGTNHLGHFALTLQLLDVIQKTSNARIVNVSSQAHVFGDINFEDLTWEKRKYKKWKAYGDSKIANLCFTNELGRKLAETGTNTKVTAAHPGWTATELQRHSGSSFLLVKLFAMKTKQGVLSTLRAAFDDNVKSGDYFGPDGFLEIKGYPVKVKMKDRAKNETIVKRLWDVSEELTGVKF